MGCFVGGQEIKCSHLLGSGLKCFRFLSSLGVVGPATTTKDDEVDAVESATLFEFEHTCLDDFREFELSPSVNAESAVVLTDSAIDNCRNHSG